MLKVFYCCLICLLLMFLSNCLISQESSATMRNSFHSCGLYLCICMERTRMCCTIWCISSRVSPLFYNS